jgi:hypothetical protein
VIVIGIDPSLSKSGISDGKRTELIATKPSDEDALGGLFHRVSSIASEYLSFINDIVPAEDTPYKVYIEGPMLNAAQAHHLYEVGFLMCAITKRLGEEHLVQVQPTTLKKFLTGDGRSPKNHKDCRKILKSGKIGPPCVSCGAKELHGIEFDKDAGKDKLHSWGLWKFGTAVESGKLEFTPPQSRGKGKAKVAKHNALVKRKQRKAARSGPTRKTSVPDVRIQRKRTDTDKAL